MSRAFPAVLLATAGAFATAADAAPVRVMSFNVRYGTAADGENHWDKRKAALAATVAKFDSDLLGTQETLAFQRDHLAGGVRIDWIAASRDWKVTSAAIDRTTTDGRPPSDHFPVTAVLE